nr:immunoglobulin light chain junction region [Macaca mulatta]MOW61527.1 immunoglobulin light chain junction region [Macaca mulatta]
DYYCAGWDNSLSSGLF